MKIIYGLIALLCLTGISGFAQTNQWAWATPVHGTGYADAESMTTDVHHNIYMSGSFDHSVLFGDTAFTTTSLDAAFIAKFDPDGKFCWARQLTSTGGDSESVYWSQIEMLNDTSFVVTGRFLYDLHIADTTLVSKGGWDVYVALYNVSGKLLKVYQIGGPRDENNVLLKADKDGNFYISEKNDVPSVTSVSFGSDTTFILNQSCQFLAKFSPDLTLKWIHKYTTSYVAYSFGSLMTDDSGNMTLLIPKVSSVITTDQDTMVPHFASSAFFQEMNPQGTTLSIHEVPNHCISVGAIDLNHDFYTVGSIAPHDTVILGQDTIITNAFYDILLVSYDSLFNLKWYNHIMRQTLSYGIELIGLTTDNVILGVSYSDFMNICNFNFNSWHKPEFVFAYFNKDGACQDAFTTNSESAYVDGVAIHVDDCDLILCGVNGGETWFGNDTINAPGGAFVAKFHHGGTVLDLGPDTTVCGSLMLNGIPGGREYYWSDGSSLPSLLVNQTGSYSLKMITAGDCYTEDSIFVTVKPLPLFDLGKDTSITVHQMLVLSLPPGFDNYLWNTGVTEHTFIVDGGKYNPGTYVFSVTARLGDCYATDSIRVSIKDNIGIGEVDKTGSVSIRPNPAHSEVNIHFSNVHPGEYAIELTTITGEPVMMEKIFYNGQTSTVCLRLPELGKGMYFLRINGNDRFIKKLVIN